MGLKNAVRGCRFSVWHLPNPDGPVQPRQPQFRPPAPISTWIPASGAATTSTATIPTQYPPSSFQQNRHDRTLQQQGPNQQQSPGLQPNSNSIPARSHPSRRKNFTTGRRLMRRPSESPAGFIPGLAVSLNLRMRLPAAQRRPVPAGMGRAH